MPVPALGYEMSLGEAFVHDLERDLGIVMTSEDVLAQITEETANFVVPEPTRELEGRFGGAPGPQLHSMELRNVLRVLVEAGLTPVEFGDQITYRYGWPQVLNMVNWYIPDNQISRASTTLRRNGWPQAVLSGDRFTKGRGYWSTSCQAHLIDTWTVVVLLPLSSVGIWLHQTELVPSTFFPEYKVQTPLLPHYVATLIDYILAHRVGFRHSRHQAETDLLRFIFVHLLHGEPVYTRREPDDCVVPPVGQIEDYERRVAEGISVVRGWDWSGLAPEYRQILEDTIMDREHIWTLNSAPLRQGFGLSIATVDSEWLVSHLSEPAPARRGVNSSL
ncbi:hypothetical protein N7493_006503 [Penicillium malachiteum]|uniref:Uncharacterized protein n=1 Tax=Penicillium malachiteum TaxID=1324776 RepID=A0AAD6HLJ7_9EURO|nr:hypothetical protein N7493_006503 [Penicillium malachiteum]